MLDVVLLICRFVLAAVFVTAALAKFLDLSGARRAFGQLGVPERIVPAAVIVVSVVELATAVALVPAATARVAALAASVLLMAFTVIVGVAVARGAEADCHCFGSVSAKPVGWGTLVRNVVLLALGGLVAAGGAGTSATAWIADLTPVETVLAAVSTVLAVGLAFNTAFLFQLFRQNGRLWAELEEWREGASAADAPEIGLGEMAPSFTLPDLNAVPVDLDDLLDEGRGLRLVFSDTGCGACETVMPAVAERQRDPAADPRVVLINLGGAEANREKAAEYGLDMVLLIDDFDLPRSLGVTGTPGIVELDADGRVAAPPVLGAVRIGELFGHAPDQPMLVTVGGNG